MRQIQISVKNEKVQDVSSVLKKIGYENIIKLEEKEFSLLIFRTKNTSVPEVLKELRNIGVGVDYGLIDILPIEATIPIFAEAEDTDRIKSGSLFMKRITMVEILNDIERDSRPTLDYFIFIVLSAIIAGIGLFSNSIILLIASMIISPLMGPILGFSFGLITKNKKIFRKSLLAQTLGVISAVATGSLLAFFYILFKDNVIITSEMAIRSYPTILDVLVSLAGGIAAGLCISGRVKSSMVGIAIALSLMPPAVNVGTSLMLGNFNLSLGSFVLLLANILIINVTTLLIMRLTEFKSIPHKKWFWQTPNE